MSETQAHNSKEVVNYSEIRSRLLLLLNGIEEVDEVAASKILDSLDDSVGNMNDELLLREDIVEGNA